MGAAEEVRRVGISSGVQRNFGSMALDDRPVVVFVLGGPGAGKGTQCARISSAFHFKHISAGDCLREERLNGGDSKEAVLIEHCIAEGLIVPIEITCALLMKKMEALGWANGRFLIDGFPRDQANLAGWLRASGDCVRTEFVLNLKCPDEVMMKRLIARGAQGSGRIDDNEECALKRLKTFHLETEPVLEYFTHMDRCYEVDAARSIDQVWEDVSKIFSSFTQADAVAGRTE